MSSSHPIRVLIADDQEVVRRGMRIFLRAFNDLELVGEARDGHEAVILCGELSPDVVLMDILMPEMDGIEATRQIKHKFPRIQIIALTSLKDDSLIEGIMAAGAAQHLLKNASIDEMAQLIRSVAGRA